jgi:DNA-binding Xre family transcriptional regulator
MKKFNKFFFSEDIKHEEEKLYAREDLVYNVTEDLLVYLEDYNISKEELAKRLGKSTIHITKLLNGTRGITLGTLSDICFVLGFKPIIILPVKENNLDKE